MNSAGLMSHCKISVSDYFFEITATWVYILILLLCNGTEHGGKMRYLDLCRYRHIESVSAGLHKAVLTHTQTHKHT